jgi:signal transduction histidine kinase
LFSQLSVVALGGISLVDIWVLHANNGLHANEGVARSRPIETMISLLICTILLWRRRAPVVVLSAVMFVVGVQAVLIDPFFRYPDELPTFEGFVALLLGFYSLGAYAEERHAILGGAAAGAVILAVDIPRLLSGGVLPGNIIPAWIFYVVVWFMGWTIHRRQLQAAQLRDLAAQLEVEREKKAQTAVAEERNRIAREMHDVVAHAVSVMVVQSQAAQRLLDGEQSAARQALGSIETTGRQALTEMRRLLGIVRRTDAELDLAPQPSLKRLEDLIEQVREAGLPVELRVEGEASSLPPGVDLSAYRIVQEALTNTLKHAKPSHAKVVIRYRDDELEVEVTDDGAGSGNGVGSKQGMIGMRERVALYGGVLESGKKAGGGYVVRARLPLDSNRP